MEGFRGDDEFRQQNGVCDFIWGLDDFKVSVSANPTISLPTPGVYVRVLRMQTTARGLFEVL